MRWAARLGGICALAQGRAGDAGRLLDELLALFGAAGGFIGLSDAAGEVLIVDRGMDSQRLAAACDGLPEPPALREAAGGEPVRMFGAALAAITLGAATHDGPVLRVHAADGVAEGTVVLWFDAEASPSARSRGELVIALRAPVLDALLRLTNAASEEDDAPLEVAALGAWSRCNVPLLFLSPDGDVVAANPAAWRKLELSGEQPRLPTWLAGQVVTRLEGLRRVGGLPEGVSGDYAWVVENNSDALLRVGLAPVIAPARDDGAAWLLSVESGGPTTGERIRAAAEAFALTPREADVLGALAEGLSNRLIADAVGICEATVKFHLVSVMRKADSSNRTELLATLYSLPV